MKKEWNDPVIKKMDIEETALGSGLELDGELGDQVS
jgi:hypothetical protein